MLYVPSIVFLFGSRGPDPGTATAVVLGLFVLAAVGLATHALLSPEPVGRVLLLAVPTAVLTGAAAFGVFLLVLLSGGCGDNGHVPALAWGGAIVIYLVGGAVALRRSVHALWAVPASLLVAGIWLVGVATALTGSTGFCLD
jgi:hypothetical protein